jgi:zinc protease
MTHAVFQEIESLRNHGPSPVDLQKVREMIVRGREGELRRNHFWLQQILVHHRHGWDLSEIPSHEIRLAAVQADRVREAAVRYLDLANYVQVSLVPERDGAGR